MTVLFLALKKTFKAAPLKSMDAGLQQSNALYATGMNEKKSSQPT